MSLKKGITSQDPVVLKRVRGTAKGRVSCVYKLFRCTLIRREKHEFVLEVINREEVEEKHSTLRKNFNEIKIITNITLTSNCLWKILRIKLMSLLAKTTILLKYMRR